MSTNCDELTLCDYSVCSIVIIMYMYVENHYMQDFTRYVSFVDEVFEHSLKHTLSRPHYFPLNSPIRPHSAKLKVPLPKVLV